MEFCVCFTGKLPEMWEYLNWKPQPLVGNVCNACVVDFKHFHWEETGLDFQIVVMKSVTFFCHDVWCKDLPLSIFCGLCIII